MNRFEVDETYTHGRCRSRIWEYLCVVLSIALMVMTVVIIARVLG